MSQLISYCLFRYGKIALALPSKVIREVMPRPDIVSIPRTARIVSGLSHVRSEFLPVLNLHSLLPDEPSGNESILLIVDDAAGDWGLLVDEVLQLTELELSNAPEDVNSGWESTVVGWANSGNGNKNDVVRILDSIRFRELAGEMVNSSPGKLLSPPSEAELEYA